MVQAMIKISKDANQILNVVKAKYGLKDKSQAIEKVIQIYGHDFLEPKLRPEFVDNIKHREKERKVEIKDFDKHFGL